MLEDLLVVVNIGCSLLLWGLRHLPKMLWWLDTGLHLLAILPSVVGISSRLDVSCGKGLLDSSELAGLLETNETLEVGCAVLSLLQLSDSLDCSISSEHVK